jgi:hypothetical protein
MQSSCPFIDNALQHHAYAMPHCHYMDIAYMQNDAQIKQKPQYVLRAPLLVY